MICCFTIKKFWCMSLPTAGVVIGWVGTIINLLLCGIFAKFNNMEEYFTSLELGDRYHAVFGIGYSSGTSFFFVISLIGLISSVCLIVGTIKKSHLMLLPWLIDSGIALAFKFCLGFGIIGGISAGTPEGSGQSLIPVYLSILTILVIYGWIWNAVFSLFKSIQKGSEHIAPDEVILVGRDGSNGYKFFHDMENEY